MLKIDKEFLLNNAKEILETPSPTGFTKEVVSLLEKKITELGFSTYKTNKGNLMVEVEGEDPSYTVGLSAHVDTLGLMVRSINEDGTLNIDKLGGPILNTYDGEYCTIITSDNKHYQGTVLSKSPSVHVYEDANFRKRDTENMMIRIDEVVKSKQDVLDLGIGNGDYIAIDPKVEIFDNGFIKSRFLDDKISVTILISLLKLFKEHQVKPKNNLILMFSTYEEVGHGLAWVPEEVNEILSVDMGCVGKDLDCTEYDVSICAKDSSGPYDYNMVNTLKDLAFEHELDYAVDIYPMYGSDTSAALRGGNDIKGGLIGPGVAASHGMERTHYNAVENTLKLLWLYLI